jgi:hypothetical protein
MDFSYFSRWIDFVIAVPDTGKEPHRMKSPLPIPETISLAASSLGKNSLACQGNIAARESRQ